jgi:peptidyl-prolyl cis-trans isomerase C
MKALNRSNVLILAALTTSAFAQKPAVQPQVTPGAPPSSAAQAPRLAPGTTMSAPAPAATVAADAVVLTIGDRKYTRAQFEEFVAALPDQLKAAVNGPQKRKFIEQYAELEALAQEARNRKLDQKPSVHTLVAIQTDQVLANQLYQDLAANVKVDDAAVKAYYDQHKSDFEEAKARHILIRFKGSGVPLRPGQQDLTEEQALAKAKEIREKIEKGGDFAALAKAESDDTGSGANGGELGSFGHGRMVKEFDEAIWTLPIGQVSEPVKTQFGYHIIQVESRTAKPFDQAKQQIESKLKPELTKKAVDEVKNHTQVTINDDYFGK